MKFSGYTMIEILVVVSTLAVVFGSGMASYNLMKNKAVLNTTTKLIMANLQNVQKKVLSGQYDCGLVELNGVLIDYTSSKFRVEVDCNGTLSEVETFPSEALPTGLAVTMAGGWRVNSVVGIITNESGDGVSPPISISYYGETKSIKASLNKIVTGE